MAQEFEEQAQAGEIAFRSAAFEGELGRHLLPAVTFLADDWRIVADDAPGLLHKVSRAISGRGCDVDLVLIATEGKKAVDVLHITKGGKKLNESDQVSLREDLERMLADTHEAR